MNDVVGRVSGFQKSVFADAAVRACGLENMVVRIAHLRTRPAVASRIARGEPTLHGWFVDSHAGSVLALDGITGRFVPIVEDVALPVALKPERQLAADFDFVAAIAAQ